MTDWRAYERGPRRGTSDRASEWSARRPESEWSGLKPESDWSRPNPEGEDPTVPARRGRAAWYWLLALPGVLPLVLPLYDRVEPRLLGFPFFYWCQLAFAGLAVVCLSLTHVLTKGRR
jgi:hypothetical protein